MTAGEWHETVWCTDTWHEDVWTDYGTGAVIPKAAAGTSSFYYYYYYQIPKPFIKRY